MVLYNKSIILTNLCLNDLKIYTHFIVKTVFFFFIFKVQYHTNFIFYKISIVRGCIRFIKLIIHVQIYKKLKTFLVLKGNKKSLFLSTEVVRQMF